MLRCPHYPVCKGMRAEHEGRVQGQGTRAGHKGIRADYEGANLITACIFWYHYYPRYKGVRAGCKNTRAGPKSMSIEHKGARAVEN